jgi:hypothetical protein
MEEQMKALVKGLAVVLAVVAVVLGSSALQKLREGDPDLTKAQEQTNKIAALGVAVIALAAVLLMLLVVSPRRRPGYQVTTHEIPRPDQPVLPPAFVDAGAVSDTLSSVNVE